MFIDSNKGNIKDVFHFKEKLANGGFGVVYLAENRQTKEKFAVKAIQKKRVKDYTTFINEINILRVLVSFETQLVGPPAHHQALRNLGVERSLLPCAGVSYLGDLYLLARYCEGGELFNFILERKHLNEQEAALIMRQLLSALVYLHSHNISHRDIKPENFMLAKRGDPSCVKMIDFGLSKDFSG